MRQNPKFTKLHIIKCNSIIIIMYTIVMIFDI